jgi:hypothetical protein
MRLAETIPSPGRATDLARHGLALLERLGEAPEGRRAREFRAALDPRG